MRFRKKDFGFITDCQATYMNEDKIRKDFKWYKVWRAMINRCYNINDPSYKHYGAKGVYVSEEFKLASVFRDWYLANNPNGNLVMDKDTICEEKGISPKYYGKDTVMFITLAENSKEMMDRNMKDEEWRKEFTDRIRENIKRGVENKNSKPMEYYETRGTKRGHFKTACKKQGWNFDDFIEIDSGERYCNKNNNKHDAKYYYIYKYKNNNT